MMCRKKEWFAPAVILVLAIGYVRVAHAEHEETHEEGHHHEGGHHPNESTPDHESSHGHGEAKHHEDGNRLFVGIKGSYAAEFTDHEVHHFGGGGLLFAVLAVPGWLEIELSVRAMANSHVIGLPIDLLFKIPFHFSDVVHPFVGLGAIAIPTFDHHGDHGAVHWGGVATVGSYFWLNPSWAIVAELTYDLVYNHGLVHGLATNAGFAFGW
jgi:hypothetical protein